MKKQKATAVSRNPKPNAPRSSRCPSSPPKWATCLLVLFRKDKKRSDIFGDLLEAYDKNFDLFGPEMANRLFFRDSVDIIWAQHSPKLKKARTRLLIIVGFIYTIYHQLSEFIYTVYHHWF